MSASCTAELRGFVPASGHREIGHDAFCREYSRTLRGLYVRDLPKQSVDVGRILDRVSFIRKNVDRLTKLAVTPFESFSEDQCHIAVRLLQVSIEALIEVGSHIVAREGLGIPKSYADVFILLARDGMIPNDLLDTAKAMVKFRNRAVHLYHDIDPSKVHSILRTRLVDFETLLRFIAARYLSEPI